MPPQIPTVMRSSAFTGAGGLAGRYLGDPGFARTMYGAHFGDDEAVARLAGKVRARPYGREALAKVLRKQNVRWGLSDEAAANIDALESEALCVIAGQQTGLFTGPLYTVYKALAAVWEARRRPEGQSG